MRLFGFHFCFEIHLFLPHTRRLARIPLSLALIFRSDASWFRPADTTAWLLWNHPTATGLHECAILLGREACMFASLTTGILVSLPCKGNLRSSVLCFEACLSCRTFPSVYICLQLIRHRSGSQMMLRMSGPVLDQTNSQHSHTFTLGYACGW